MLGRIGTKDALMKGGSTIYRRAAVVVAFLLFAALLVPLKAHAQLNEADLGLDYATATGLGTTDIRTTASLVIRAFLGLLGLVAVVTILYAGVLWMTAGGNEEKVSTAKKILINGTIGLTIILSAYAIVTFLFRALNPDGNGSVIGGGGSALTSLYSSGRGTGALGSGIINSHYPESGQTDVARNTKIAITMKKPMVLSTVLRNYMDGPFVEGVMASTPTIEDDYVCPGGLSSDTSPDGSCTKVTDILADDGSNPAYEGLLELDLMNVKIVPNDVLASPSGGSDDEQFDQRYAGQDPFFQQFIPRVSFTPTTEVFDPEEYQTLTIKPVEPIGSPSADTNYRVAIRGGANGVLVWSAEPGTGAVFAEPAFTELNADGSYFWPFVVGTGIDLTPPQARAIVPGNRAYLDRTEGIFRNQLLQVYFNEAIDPTSASGTLPGFTKIVVEARCLSGEDCEEVCTGDPIVCTEAYEDARDAGTWVPVAGEIKLFNRYRTIEFSPSTPCDDVAENSCGEEVFCLPRNTELRIVARAAYVGADAPAASSENGILDMVGNSFDGNMNGTTEGPSDNPGGTAGLLPYSVNTYRFNRPSEDVLATMNDTLIATFHVGKKVDLDPPFVTDITPRSGAQPCAGTPEDPCPSTAFTPSPGGPSRFPTTQPVVIEWNEAISVGSIRTGKFDENLNDFADSSSTVVLRAFECPKEGDAPCKASDASCPCTEGALDPPAFLASADILSDATSGEQWTELSLIHRPFFTGNDLGYTIEELDLFKENAPVYEPIVRSQIRDTRQNCFWPSVGFECGNKGDQVRTSCCDRTSDGTFTCPLSSSP